MFGREGLLVRMPFRLCPTAGRARARVATRQTHDIPGSAKDQYNIPAVMPSREGLLVHMPIPDFPSAARAHVRVPIHRGNDIPRAAMGQNHIPPGRMAMRDFWSGCYVAFSQARYGPSCVLQYVDPTGLGGNVWP